MKVGWPRDDDVLTADKGGSVRQLNGDVSGVGGDGEIGGDVGEGIVSCYARYLNHRGAAIAHVLRYTPWTNEGQMIFSHRGIYVPEIRLHMAGRHGRSRNRILHDSEAVSLKR